MQIVGKAVIFACLLTGCTPNESASDYVKPADVVSPADLPQTNATLDSRANPFAPLVVEFALDEGKIEGAVGTTGDPVPVATLEFNVLDKNKAVIEKVRTRVKNIRRDEPVYFQISVPRSTASAVPVTLKPES